VAQQKLIYSGKILTDAQTVEECKIKEKDFLVVMVSKVRSGHRRARLCSPSSPSRRAAKGAEACRRRRCCRSCSCRSPRCCACCLCIS
jgi:UV excision repair protein RAD23